MFRRALVTAIVCVVPVGAIAQPNGINLFWDDCSLGMPYTNKTISCDSNSGPAHDLIVSLQTFSLIDDVVGAEGTIVVTMDAATVPDFWRLDASGCRYGVLSTNPNVGATSAPYSCIPAWVGAGNATGSATFYYLPYTQCSPNQAVIRWSVGASVPVTLDPSVGAGEFYLTKLSFARNGTGACGGCEIAACLVATEMRLLRPSGDLVVTSPALSQHVTTQGGGTTACPGFDSLPSCPVPARASTWGRIKSMYR